MRVPRDDKKTDSAPGRLLGTAMLTMFALSVLAFLVVVDRHGLFVRSASAASTGSSAAAASIATETAPTAS